MKKIILTLAALTAFSGAALATSDHNPASFNAFPVMANSMHKGTLATNALSTGHKVRIQSAANYINASQLR